MVWTWCSTASVDLTSGVPARPCAAAGRSSPTGSRPRFVTAGSLPAVPIVATASARSGSLLLPGRKRVVPYSIQTLKRINPRLFREDLAALFDLLKEHKVKPLVAERFPLVASREAHELLGKGGVTGKIVLVSGV